MSDFETNKNLAAVTAAVLGGTYLLGGIATGAVRNWLYRPTAIQMAVEADGFPGYHAGSSFGGSRDTAKFGNCTITIAGLNVEPTLDTPKKDLSDFSPANLVALHEVGGVSDYDVVVPNKGVYTVQRVQNAGELRDFAAANAIPEWRLCFPDSSNPNR